MTEENGQGVDAQGNWQNWYDKPSTPTEGGRQGWDEGGALEDMTQEQALKEIKAIENDPSFAGEGKLDYWSRQNMLKRRDALYRQAYPENVGKEYSGMEETLQKQGITKETLEADQGRFADRDEKESRKKTMENLISHFGTEDDAKQAITEARGLLNRFAKPDDLIFLDETGLGNNADFIQKLAEIGRMLNPKKEV
ncbi:MAG TPA: hypothetical protein VMW09_00215 [Desulfatiglandales bacterium]|nr:hypothetical protein [Desulfatiglandales bacterium]